MLQTFGQGCAPAFLHGVVAVQSSKLPLLRWPSCDHFDYKEGGYGGLQCSLEHTPEIQELQVCNVGEGVGKGRYSRRPNVVAPDPRSAAISTGANELYSI